MSLTVKDVLRNAAAKSGLTPEIFKRQTGLDFENFLNDAEKSAEEMNIKPEEINGLLEFDIQNRKKRC